MFEQINKIGIEQIKDKLRYLKSGGAFKSVNKKNKIYIKPENEGKFTKSAKAAGESVQEHAHHVVSDPNATELQRKRAQFAINAKKWHH